MGAWNISDIIKVYWSIITNNHRLKIVPPYNKKLQYLSDSVDYRVISGLFYGEELVFSL